MKVKRPLRRLHVDWRRELLEARAQARRVNTPAGDRLLVEMELLAIELEAFEHEWARRRAHRLLSFEDGRMKMRLRKNPVN